MVDGTLVLDKWATRFLGAGGQWPRKRDCEANPSECCIRKADNDASLGVATGDTICPRITGSLWESKCQQKNA